MKRVKRIVEISGLLLLAFLAICPGRARAEIQGLVGTDFEFTTSSGHISAGDGDNLFFWGYGVRGQNPQYPGPTLIVRQGDTITIRLNNRLPQNSSILIPGFKVEASGGVPGLLAREAPIDGTTEVVYSFVVDRPGTFGYYSGSNSDLQVEMGLIGAIIVRPSGFSNSAPSAYGDARSAYDDEFLFLLSEMDPVIHHAVEIGEDPVATTGFHPVLWFINGRNGPDTMAAPNVTWLPNQPYNCMPNIEIGKRLLLRWFGGGRDHHPFHTHGNNFDLIARDGYLLESSGGASRVASEVGVVPDLAVSDFTQNVAPGASYDAVWSWTGAELEWDVYGHTGNESGICEPGPLPATTIDAQGFDLNTGEYCADHGKPLPVVLPCAQQLTFGGFYSGSPFLGAEGSLPPGEGGNNPSFGFAFMWHSHNEKEMTNNDIFPGGMMTMMIVNAPGS